MRKIKQLFPNRIILLLLYYFLAGISVADAQDTDTNDEQQETEEFDKQFEKTTQIIVMIKADYGSTPEFGAGIIFSYGKDKVLIATAYHILHKGLLSADNISVSFKTNPDKSFKATVIKTPAADDIDLAVIEVDNLKKQDIDICALPFDYLADSASLKRRDSVYSVGNPNGVSWAIPPDPDRVAQVSGNNIVFQSTFISSGHSGGALLDKNGLITGMTVADEPPLGRAIDIFYN